MVTGYLLEQFVLANKAHIPALPQGVMTNGLRDDTTQEPHVSPRVFSLFHPTPFTHCSVGQFLGVGKRFALSVNEKNWLRMFAGAVGLGNNTAVRSSPPPPISLFPSPLFLFIIPCV